MSTYCEQRGEGHNLLYYCEMDIPGKNEYIHSTDKFISPEIFMGKDIYERAGGLDVFLP